MKTTTTIMMMMMIQQHQMCFGESEQELLVQP
jgi:hypothetical protein